MQNLLIIITSQKQDTLHIVILLIFFHKVLIFTLDLKRDENSIVSQRTLTWAVTINNW